MYVHIVLEIFFPPVSVARNKILKKRKKKGKVKKNVREWNVIEVLLSSSRRTKRSLAGEDKPIIRSGVIPLFPKKVEDGDLLLSLCFE